MTIEFLGGPPDNIFHLGAQLHSGVWIGVMSQSDEIAWHVIYIFYKLARNNDLFFNGRIAC